MKKYDELWHNINNLLSFLRNFDIVKKVDDYYLQYGNNAPASLIEIEINKLQEKLDNAKN